MTKGKGKPHKRGQLFFPGEWPSAAILKIENSGKSRFFTKNEILIMILKAQKILKHRTTVCWNKAETHTHTNSPTHTHIYSIFSCVSLPPHNAKNFKASAQWFQRFRRRWGFTFQEKTNVKKKSVQQRLPYVRKHHQYLLYTAFREEPLEIIW